MSLLFLLKGASNTTYSYTGSGGATAGGAATAYYNAFVPTTYRFTAGGPFEVTGLSVTGTPRPLFSDPLTPVTLSGAATTSYTESTGTTYPYTASGGMTVGGAATLARIVFYPYTASGGVTAGGAADIAHLYIYPYTASGGLTAGGTATSSQYDLWVYTASGGATVGGEAVLSKTKVYTGADGITSGGAAVTSYTVVGGTEYPYAASGGMTVAGAADTFRLVVTSYTASGGMTLAGAGDTSQVDTWTYVSSGGMTTGGAADLARLTVWTYTPTGGVTAGGAGTIARLSVYTFSSWYFDPYFGQYFDLPDGITIGGFADTEYNDANLNYFSYAGTGGAELGGAATTAYEVGDEYTPPVYGGIFSRPTRKDQEKVKKWLEKSLRKVFKYKGSGRLRLRGEASTGFVPNESVVIPFKVSEGVKRPILRLKKPRTEVPVESVKEIKRKAAARKARLQAEDEYFLLHYL